jgi:hypothetical protein
MFTDGWVGVKGFIERFRKRYVEIWNTMSRWLPYLKGATLYVYGVSFCLPPLILINNNITNPFQVLLNITSSTVVKKYLLNMSDSNSIRAYKNLVVYGIGDKFEDADPTIIGPNPEKVVEYGSVAL